MLSGNRLELKFVDELKLVCWCSSDFIHLLIWTKTKLIQLLTLETNRVTLIIGSLKPSVFLQSEVKSGIRQATVGSSFSDTEH
uniref:Uncharacterized protein n=1 Tax=Arundo donax TaxID=35708 RepID=A0A0A9A1N3_ARUDO